MMFLISFIFAFPIWMLAIPLYLAFAIRDEFPNLRTLPAALVIGTISTVTGLAYRRCQTGLVTNFDSQYMANISYRGLPFRWISSGGYNLSFEPIGYVFLNMLIWVIVAYAVLELIDLAQSFGIWRAARVDTWLAVGAALGVLPLLIALVASGRGC